jgi:transcription elongation GreA/GreB family factor
MKKSAFILFALALLLCLCPAFASSNEDESARPVDNNPPKVKGITLNTTSVTAPGTITVTVKAMDDISGLAYGIVWFRNVEANTSLSASLKVNGDGKMTGTIEIGPYTRAGVYIIENLELDDNADNYVIYYGKGSESYSGEEIKLPDVLAGLSFTVVQDSSSTSITIKTQPKDAKVKSGSKAKFTVKVKEKNVTYQWFTVDLATLDWTVMAGETKATLNVVGTKANNGTMYRCRIRNKEGREVYSNVAFLTVTLQKPVIKTQPKNLSVKSGKKVKFSVKASGKNITYQWFTRANAESEWQPVAGSNKKDLNVVASKANNGSQYYCYLKNADGDATSAIVTLTVTPEAPTIKTQPKDAKVKIGAKAKFKVKASGKNVTYQWYYRTSEAGEWVLMEGETSANLTVVATEGNIGWQFRCLAKNADGQVYSKPATLRQK